MAARNEEEDNHADDYSDSRSGSGRDSDQDSDIVMEDAPPSYEESQTSGPLGLINGTYSIECEDLEQWRWTSDDFSLILTLEGDRVWGAYDFGMYHGILNMSRPYTAGDNCEIRWRGTDRSEGQISYSDSNTGYINFLGGGRIEGMIDCYGKAEFTGRRVSGRATRSERDAWSMRDEWRGYNSNAYEEANRARWG